MLSKIMEGHIPVEIDRMRRADFIESQLQTELKKIKRIENGHQWRGVADCPLCGYDEYREEFKKHDSPLVTCSRCALRYHRRVPADLNDVYQDSDYELYAMEDSEEHFRYRKNRFGKERVELLEKICGSLEDKKLLDVGCGNGFFLAAAKERCKSCFGSEFSATNRKIAEKNTGLPVYPNPLESFPEKGFDIITAFDVIEHIGNPVQFVKAASDLLKPGGHILLYTPNFDSFSVRVMKEYSSIVDPTEHMVLFSRDSVEYLGDITGLKVVHFETRGLDINSIVAYMGTDAGTFLHDWLNELQAMIDFSGAADYLRVIYKKDR